ncbi:MAG: choice-of-anchor J domain-containing protein, partial [Candidatus Cloacimonadaceae bacterium]|nr:choice-of-anchor J domain-containing protein [Candidatus Cloacimonadaceae bacterium]
MKKSIIIYLFLIALLGTVSLAFAQIPAFEYNFSATAGTYTPITTGTVYGDTATDDQRFVDPAAPLGSTTVMIGPGLPIGFDFTYLGVVYDRVGINANGWISLGQSALGASAVNINSTSGYTSLGSTTAITPAQLVSRISAMGRDLQAQEGAELMVATIGVAPNREYVVQWTNYRKYNVTGDSYNFQIRLQETTNNVVIVYGTVLNNATSTTIQIGLRGEPVTPASNFKVLSCSTNWASPSIGALVTESLTLSSTVYPASGTTYTFSPPVAGAVPNPANLVSPANGGWAETSQTLNWMSGGGLPDSYDVYFGTSPNPPFIQNQLGTSYAPTLAAGTTYYWQILPRNEFGSAENCPIWSFRTPSNTQIFESFEATTFPPPGWGNPGAFTRSTTTPYHGVGNAYKFTNATTPFLLHTPRLDLTEQSSLSFWGRTASTNADQRITIMYSADATSWNPVGTPFALTNGTNWTNYVADLSTLAGNGYFIGFQVSTVGATGSVYIDYVIGPEITPEAPGVANNVYPVNGGYSFTNGVLSWTAGTGITSSYDVYFGTTPNPPFVQNQTATTYTPTLAENTTYYWQIVPRNAFGSTENCPVWSFSTPRIGQLAEGFEATTFPPIGWTNPGTYSRSTTTPFHGTAGAYKSLSTTAA